MKTQLRIACDATAGELRLCVQENVTAAWTVVFGASGSGKTSLLRMIAGLWRPKQCSIALNGEELSALPAHRRRVALVAQQAVLFPNRTVRQNVGFAPGGAPRTREVVDAMVERFRLGPLASRPVAHLSGGEAQRVCLARAMATLPRLLLLDESFSGLHRELRDELLEVLRDLQAGPHGMPIVSVTHDVGEAFTCADEVLRMDAGRVVARGTASEVLSIERADLLQRLRAL